MSRRRLVILSALATALVAAAGLLVRLDEVSTYDFHTESLEFTSDGNALSGTLALPEGDGPFGLVAFIHGDGPVDADHDGGYPPIFETLADAGYASISWDKPGVGGSSGNWEHQSMSQRADEVLAAIAAVADHPMLDPQRVGAIAFSQGGWPLPLVAQRGDLEFAIAVSTAVNWRRQGRYDLDTYLKDYGASPAELALAHDYSDAERDLIDQDSTYSEYLDFVDHWRPSALARFDYFDPMSADRWHFAKLNDAADATRLLRHLRETPVLLQLGEHDIHVDIDDTETVYRRVLDPDCLRVAHYPDASHSMLKTRLENSTTALWIQALWQPRDIFVDPFLTDIHNFATHHQCL